MKTVDILIEARKLIANGWATGTGHRIKGGRHHFCSLGALDRVAGASSERAKAYLLAVINDGSFTEIAGIAVWNDRSSKKQVLAGFDKAIKNASRRHING